ncbi:MotA/TolQ/ExbB proton channel family protein [Neisseria cinerea]|uniref:MotA/TolQ/ExbB proton channel family protein n=1 Tax=Neisseria cinerea TaxID=483 RepID=UPI003C7DFF6A
MDLKLVFESGDVVLIGVFVLMLLMSIVTWCLIVLRSIKLYQARKGNKVVKQHMSNTLSLNDALEKVRAIDAPLSKLAQEALQSYRNYRQNEASKLAQALPLDKYLVIQIRNSMAQIMRRFDYGMTALASIGATAPFIGLFGTVWGIYHALINIGQSGQMSIAAVAGPIGEALVSTAAGLFVAIPAVLAYNFLNRGAKTLTQDLDAMAHDLHVRLLSQKD